MNDTLFSKVYKTVVSLLTFRVTVKSLFYFIFFIFYIFFFFFVKFLSILFLS